MDPNPLLENDGLYAECPRGDEADVRKRYCVRDGSDSDEPLRKRSRLTRSRAGTVGLLTPEPDAPSSSEPPKPEDSLEKYTPQRLRQGLSYIVGAAKRKVTPRTEQFLLLHKDAYKKALEKEPLDLKSVSLVQGLDRIYYSSIFYFKPRADDEYNHLMTYVKLRRTELLANYGDYVCQTLQVLRLRLKEAHDHPDPEIASAASSITMGTWKQHAETLNSQAAAKLKADVHVACRALGMDSLHMSWLIQECADRNNQFHNQSRDFINQCQWRELSEQIFRDLKELPHLTTDPVIEDRYEKTLIFIRDEYFNVHNPNDIQTWQVNEKALAASRAKWDREARQEASEGQRKGNRERWKSLDNA